MDKRGGLTCKGSVIHHKDMTLEILEYLDNNYRKVLIKETGTILEKLHTYQIRTGQIKDPRKPCIHGIGYFGQGSYKGKIKGKNTKEYTCWSHMMKRCYDIGYHSSHRYMGKGVVVCDEWHDFQNFAEWFKNNYKDGFELDKDIYGGLVYSPETCVFIPKPLNSFFTGRFADRGEYPIGVLFHKASNTFVASVNNGKGKTIHLGCFSNPEEAFLRYKQEKEGILLKMIEDYLVKGYISLTTYDKLKGWECIPFPE